MPRVDLPRRTYIEPNKGESVPPAPIEPVRKRAKRPARPAEEKPDGTDRN